MQNYDEPELILISDVTSSVQPVVLTCTRLLATTSSNNLKGERPAQRGLSQSEGRRRDYQNLNPHRVSCESNLSRKTP
jgi:hypothetical protein